MLLDLARRRGDVGNMRVVALALDARTRRLQTALWALGSLPSKTASPRSQPERWRQRWTQRRTSQLWLRALLESGGRAEVASFLAGADSQDPGNWSERVELLLEVGEVDSGAGDVGIGRAISEGRVRQGACAPRSMETTPKRPPCSQGSRSARRASKQHDWRLRSALRHRADVDAAAEALSQAPHYSLAVRETLAGIYLEEGALQSGPSSVRSEARSRAGCAGGALRASGAFRGGGGLLRGRQGDRAGRAWAPRARFGRKARFTGQSSSGDRGSRSMDGCGPGRPLCKGAPGRVARGRRPGRAGAEEGSPRVGGHRRAATP